jgi:hypothetical protein
MQYEILISPQALEDIRKWAIGEPKFKVGDAVYKPKGYKFPGEVRSVFTTKEGNVRYVVEMKDYGLLHIFNEGQLEADDGPV